MSDELKELAAKGQFGSPDAEARLHDQKAKQQAEIAERQVKAAERQATVAEMTYRRQLHVQVLQWIIVIVQFVIATWIAIKLKK